MSHWTSGESYERYVGRWSRVVAKKFIDWLSEPPGGNSWRAPDPGSRWLDVGGGTGSLSQAIWERSAAARVTAIDRTHAFLSLAQRAVLSSRTQKPEQAMGWAVADAQHLPLSRLAFDAVVSGLVLNFVPSPTLAVSEMKRVVRPGGIVAVYVWDYAGKMEMMRYFWDAAAELDLPARALDEGPLFPICHPDRLREAFEQAGLQQVETTGIDIDTAFRDFDDYWSPFLGGQGPAPGYVARLDEERRTALRERLRAELPAEADGSIRLAARAWAVRGVAK